MAQGYSSYDWTPNFPICDAGDSTEYGGSSSDSSSSDSDSEFVNKSVKTDPILLNLIKARKQRRQNPEQQAAERLRRDKNRVKYLEGKIMRTRNKTTKECNGLTSIGSELKQAKEDLKMKRQEFEKQKDEENIRFVQQNEEADNALDELDRKLDSVLKKKEEHEIRCEAQSCSMYLAVSSYKELGDMVQLLSTIFPIHSSNENALNGK